MTTLSWNCRGLAAVSTSSELKDICYEYKPAIVFLMETRAHKNSIERMRRRLNFQHSWCVEPRGTAGGLGLFWTNKVVLQILSSSTNFIHATVQNLEDQTDYDFTFVYGNPTFQQRRFLWNRLRALQSDKRRQWGCVGDFNELLSQQEKDGLRPQHQNRIDLFREFLSSCELMDLDMKGCKFTWTSNPRNGFITREKLDKALVNWSWRQDHPHAMAIALPIISSYHSPIILIPCPKGRSGTQFKFEAYWEEHEECKATIQEGWKSGEQNMDPWENILTKSKACKRNLQRWHRKTFRRADEEIRRLKQRLNWLLNLQSTQIDWNEIGELKKKIAELWKQEEIYWSQRSRLKWLNWGGQKL